MTPHEAAVILESPKARSFGAVRRAYRKLAIRYHPDRSKVSDAAEKFKLIGLAFDVLNDYQRNGGIWPIPRGYQPEAENFKGPKAPQPTYQDVTTPPPPKKRSQPRGDSYPPPNSRERRDKAWQRGKNRQETQAQSAALVQAEEWNRRMARYFRQVFPNEAKAQERLDQLTSGQVSIDDIKTIMANHVSGGAPIKIEYTPYGRKISFEEANRRRTSSAPLSAPIVQPSMPPPPPPSRNGSDFAFGPPLKVQPHPVVNGNSSYVPITPMPAPPIPVGPHILRINPFTYNQMMQSVGGFPASALIRAVLQMPTGALVPGVYDVRWINGIAYVNGTVCSMVLDSAAPL